MINDIEMLNAIVEKSILFLESIGYFDLYYVWGNLPYLQRKVNKEISLQLILNQALNDNISEEFYNKLDRYAFFYRRLTNSKNDEVYFIYYDLLTSLPYLGEKYLGVWEKFIIYPETNERILTINKEGVFNISDILNAFYPDEYSNFEYYKILPNYDNVFRPIFITKEPIYKVNEPKKEEIITRGIPDSIDYEMTESGGTEFPRSNIEVPQEQNFLPLLIIGGLIFLAS